MPLIFIKNAASLRFVLKIQRKSSIAHTHTTNNIMLEIVLIILTILITAIVTIILIMPLMVIYNYDNVAKFLLDMCSDSDHKDFIFEGHTDVIDMTGFMEGGGGGGGGSGRCRGQL